MILISLLTLLISFWINYCAQRRLERLQTFLPYQVLPLYDTIQQNWFVWYSNRRDQQTHKQYKCITFLLKGMEYMDRWIDVWSYLLILYTVLLFCIVTHSVSLTLYFSSTLPLVHIPSWSSIAFFTTTLVIFRTLLYSATILPDSSQQALKKVPWKRYLTGTSGDLIYSLHAASGMTCLMMQWGLIGLVRSLQDCSSHQEWLFMLWFLRLVFVLSCLLQMLASWVSIVSKRHYTIDVILGYFVSYVIFSYWIHF